MKLKTLLVSAVALLCSAESWAVTGSEITATMSDCFLYNVGADQYLTAGNWWGTHASASSAGMDLDLTKVSDGVYTIGTRLEHDPGRYLNGAWMNGNSCNWTFSLVDAEKNHYTLSYTDGGDTKYLYYTGSTVDVTTTEPNNDNYYWKVVTRTNFLSSLSVATNDSPVDATGVIYNPAFFVGDYATKKNTDFPTSRSWKGTQLTDTWGYQANEEASNRSNYCVEQYNKTFDNYQDLSDVPNGAYILRNQGFYRGTYVATLYIKVGDVYTETNMAQLSSNTSDVPDAPDGYTSNAIQRSAYAFGIADKYHNATSKVIVSNHTMRIGVRGTSTNWSCFDNFRLEYYGNAVEVYSPTSFTSNTSAAKDKWHEFSVASAGYYRINSSVAATLYYTQDNSDDADATASKTFIAGGYTFMNLTAGSFYFKTSATSTIKIEAISSSVLQNGDVVTDVFINNPSFEDADMSSWNLDDVFSRQNGSDLSGKSGDYYAGSSYTNQTKSISQSLTGLPAGNYILQAKAKAANYNSSSVNATLGIGGNTTPVRFNIEEDYSVAYNAASDDASAIISFGGKFSEYGYFYCDNFTLTYYSTMPNVSISDLTACAMDADVRAALTSASTTYSGSKTAANYNALQTAIINAKNSIAKYSTTANSNWTGLIKNPSFEGTGSGSTDGWSFTGSNDSDARSNGNATYTMTNVDGDWLFNIWATGNTISQTLENMPSGTYKLTAVMGTDAGSTFKLKLNDETGYAASVNKGTGVTVTVYAKLTAQGSLAISADAGGSQWYKVDNFQLTYNPTLPASLTAVSGKMNATVASSQSTAVSAYNATSGQTIDNLITAQAAMLAAYESKLVYNEITDIKDSYDAKKALLDATGQAAYTTATTTANTGATTKYTAGTYTTAAQAETAYRADYVTAVKAQGDNSDMTDVFVNPSFEEGETHYTGWTVTVSSGSSTSDGQHRYENWGLGEGGGSWCFKLWTENAGAGSIRQTLSQLPVGDYVLTAYVKSDADKTFTLYAGETSKAVTTPDGNPTLIELHFTQSTQGDVQIRVTNNAGWWNLDNFRLRHYDSDVYANRTSIISNNGDITSLIHDNDFQDGVTDWDGGYHCNWVKDRSWRGTSYENNHYEKNANGAMTYTVSNMPAGTYKVVAAARAAAGCTIQPEIASTTGTSLTGIGDDRNANSTVEINTNGVEMPYSDLGGFTNQGSAHNWCWITATGTLASAGDLVIKFNCTGSSWMAIDDVHLYCTELDGTSYTYTVDDDHLDAGDKVVTADIILSNPNAIITSNAAINGAAGTQINNNLVGGTIANMVLYDGNSYTSPAGEYAITNATYYRNFTSGRNATVMVPFTLDATTKEAGKAYTPTRYANDVVLFTTVDDPAADVPYVFVPSSDIPSLTGARTSASEGSKQVDGTSVTFYGTYATTSIEQNDNNYVAYNNMLWLVDNAQNSNPFRAYLHVGAPTGVKSLSIRLDDATGIQAVEGPQSLKTSIYNLAGQRLNKLQKGINIVNGKKVLVK